jgi:hypothetical protein
MPATWCDMRTARCWWCAIRSKHCGAAPAARVAITRQSPAACRSADCRSLLRQSARRPIHRGRLVTAGREQHRLAAADLPYDHQAGQAWRQPCGLLLLSKRRARHAAILADDGAVVLRPGSSATRTGRLSDPSDGSLTDSVAQQPPCRVREAGSQLRTPVQHCRGEIAAWAASPGRQGQSPGDEVVCLSRTCLNSRLRENQEAVGRRS